MVGQLSLKGVSQERFAQISGDDPYCAAYANSEVPELLIFRAMFGGNQGDSVWSSLDGGRAILTEAPQLSQYLYTHGQMIQGQWRDFFENHSLQNDTTRLIDYGCGQGLAGLALRDNLGSDFIKKIRCIILIDPSEICLARAAAVYRSLSPNADILAVCATLDDVEGDSFEWGTGQPTLHVFSNILDIATFNQFELLNKALGDGFHEIAAVSHDRNFAGGSQRFHNLRNAVEDEKVSEWLTVVDSTSETFFASPPEGKPSIRWHARLVVDK